MKRLCLLICLLCTALSALCQNLVPNGSFEQYDKCPRHYRDYAGFISKWYSLNWGTPDYYNTCNTSDTDSNIPDNYLGYEYPADGNAYVGIVVGSPLQDYAEYIGISMQPLYPGMVYEVSMSVSHADNVSAASDGLGVSFTKGRQTITNWGRAVGYPPIVSFDKYGVIKQHVGWMRVSGTFVADQAYDNILIGNFTGGALEKVRQTLIGEGYYYIDSVVMIALPWRPAPNLTINVKESSVCAGDSLVLDVSIGGKDSFNIGNVFTVDMLNKAGEVVAQSMHHAHTSGTLRTLLPNGIGVGTYGLRIISTAPPDTFLLEGSVRVDSAPNIKITTGFPRCGDDISLDLESNKPVQTYWYGPNKFAAEGNHVTINDAGTPDSGLYTAVAVIGGCSVKDTVSLRLDCKYVDVPSAFSPNGDGKNDVLQIYGTENVATLSFKIYNRWGQIVYQTTDPRAAWDGTYKGEALHSEVLVYVLDAAQKDGSVQHLKGNITIIR